MTKMSASIALPEQGDTSPPSPPAHSIPVENWVSALRTVADYYGLSMSTQAATLSGQWDVNENETERLRNLARRLGLRVRFDDPHGFDLTTSSWRLPLILELRDGQIVVVRSLDERGGAHCVLVGDQGLETTLPIMEMLDGLRRVLILRPARQAADARVDAYIEPFDSQWLRKIVVRDLRPYGHVLLGSLIANILTLSGILFSMQVYDRVVPSGSFPTLYILFSGVVLAIALGFLLRRARTSIIDKLGKRADIRLSDQVFGHALRVRNQARPTSTGSFISQLRELEQVREMLTSTTVGALADIPFFLIFLVIFWYLGGIMVLVPIGAFILLVVPGLLAQRKLRTYAREAMRESSLRNALLIETIQGIEDIKMLQAEERFQRQWNHYNAVTGEAQLKLREVTNNLTTWSAKVRGGTYASTVFFGAPLVMAGDITTGTLVGLSMLGARMMSPMARVTSIMSRLQQARVGINSLNAIMKLPVDHPERESRIHRPVINGNYQLNDAVLRYGDDTSPIAFEARKLRIAPGEKVALLGRNGAGKSTLIQALSGLLEPSAGEVLLDDVALAHIDPADVRRNVGMLTQTARLFHGTVRENLLLGAPQASGDDILAALTMVGADSFIRRLPKGLDHVILEGGNGLSGGQKQALLLARLIIRNPSVVLLDEPTAAMDEATERQFIAHFGAWCRGRTLVVATHRTRVLDLVDRLIVIDGGKVLRDGPRDQVLKGGGTPRKAAPAAQTGMN
ncbi:type I secretion system permease/ATPase [Sphingobium baderi]|uniref:type I secretion system permease/ATPase n=2 Tax=Sphingobium baderi TaxID=1332080 RepID=UPI000A4750FC|nr:type I secretion system permease/ATPase [Sphingobium baderi]